MKHRTLCMRADLVCLLHAELTCKLKGNVKQVPLSPLVLWVVQRAGDSLTSGLKTCWRHPGLPLPPVDPSSPQRWLVYLNHNQCR